MAKDSQFQGFTYLHSKRIFTRPKQKPLVFPDFKGTRAQIIEQREIWRAQRNLRRKANAS